MQKNRSKKQKEQFTPQLLKWNKQYNKRKMPWKSEKDPYKIWLSEIILQQTRVEQGLRYYNNFIAAFPNVHVLAAAPEKKVFKLWEGLGYYNRCKNLIVTAKFISAEKKGQFPANYEEIKKLKGIGPYTAAAISSFAFNLPHAVVDGNVFRLLARIFGINKPVDSAAGKKYFSALAEKLLDKTKPGIYNQAIMDFGATVCKPAAPACINCVFKKICVAYRTQTVHVLPLKEKKINIRQRWFYYLVLEKDKKFMIRQRGGKDIWQQLYEFPLVELEKDTALKTVLKKAEKEELLIPGAYEFTGMSDIVKQQLSHQLVCGRFISVKLKGKGGVPKTGFWVNRTAIKRYPFPVFIKQFLSGKPRQQSLF